MACEEDRPMNAHRPRGRPRKAEDQRLQPLTTALKAEDYRRVCAQARAQDVTVAALTRQWITGCVLRLLPSQRSS